MTIDKLHNSKQVFHNDEQEFDQLSEYHSQKDDFFCDVWASSKQYIVTATFKLTNVLWPDLWVAVKMLLWSLLLLFYASDPTVEMKH